MAINNHIGDTATTQPNLISKNRVRNFDTISLSNPHLWENGNAPLLSGGNLRQRQQYSVKNNA